MWDHEGTMQIKHDDISMKTKIILTRFGVTSGTLRFDEKTFFHTLLGFKPYGDYKPTSTNHADNPGVYISDKTLNLSTIEKVNLNSNVVDGSLVNGLREPILYSFVLDKLPGFKVFCQPEALHYKKSKQICFEYYNILSRRWQ